MWETPIKIEPDTMMCVWHSPWSGSFEFLCGSERARELLNGGMSKVNGRPCSVEVVAEWPELGAIQLHVSSESVENKQQYVWELAAA